MRASEVTGWDAEEITPGVLVAVFVSANRRNVGTCRHNTEAQCRNHVQSFAGRRVPKMEAPQN